jgi:hypothetical protein
MLVEARRAFDTARLSVCNTTKLLEVPNSCAVPSRFSGSMASARCRRADGKVKSGADATMDDQQPRPMEASGGSRLSPPAAVHRLRW